MKTETLTMDFSIYATTKKPNINVPDGMELYWNINTNHWALRPKMGYSATYLKKDTFVPKRYYESAASQTNPVIHKEITKTKNKNLHSAKREKNDEFYTRMEDIANELKHYKEFFKDKVVYCPCDKAFNLGRSNFFEFFRTHFVEWGLKKLIATQWVEEGRGWCWIVERGDVNCDGYIDESEIDTYQLDHHGDFFDDECLDFIKECDIICTNPPFSAFRPFIKRIMDNEKQFLIIGNQNAITYKEIFPLIKENKLWLGYNTPHDFEIPIDSVQDETKQYETNGKIFQKFGSICWFTNLPHNKRKEILYLGGVYHDGNPKYPQYDNYDAIDVSKVSEIPDNYYGTIGVPITYLYKYNPEQFEIIKFRKGDDNKDLRIGKKEPYFRILIRRKKLS